MQKLEKTISAFHKRIENGVTAQSIRRFKTIIRNYYKTHGREFSWRSDIRPYRILVSEIMLQQTQTSRVAQKYAEWMSAFPDFETLAEAPLKKILPIWQGMGYNRRAIALKKCAEIVMKKYKGKLPNTTEELIALPHVGLNTAGSIAAFAFNKPTIFIETNIRSVFISFFFPNKSDVHDDEIRELVEKTLDKKNPREWYYALMDYGVLLKATFGNPNKKSRHYNKQSTFKGSNRELRGAILRELNSSKALGEKELQTLLKKQNISTTILKLRTTLKSLADEGFVGEKNDTYSIK